MLSTTPLRALRTHACAGKGVASIRFASHGAPHYNEPSGYVFGEKPPAPGQKRLKEDWENIWYFGMFGSIGLAALLLYYKPDTSIQGWALKEAKARMGARGEKVHYESPPSL